MLVLGFGFVFVCSFIRLGVYSFGRPRQAEPSHENRSSLVTRHSPLAHGDFIAVCVAALSAVGLFVFKYCLTGQCQFHSIEFKGHFVNLPTSDAVWATITDSISMLRQLVLGQPAGSATRATFAMPFLGAVFCWVGVLRFDWRKGGLPFAGWLLSCLVSLLSVASGGMQGTNFDRYIAWLLPTCLIFVSYGILQMADWIKDRASWEAVAALVILFQFTGAISALSWFASASRHGQIAYETTGSAAAAIEGEKGDVGGAGAVGGAYLFEGRRVYHLSGYYSPAFRSREQICNAEVLKHEPENRFVYWFSASRRPMLGFFDVTSLVGEQVFQGLNGFSLWKADWTRLDNACMPCATNSPVVGLALVDRVDVGYLRDEKRTGFAVNYRLPGLSYLAFAMDGECGGTRLFDVGRPVIGWSEMRVHLRPGQDAVAVVRMVEKVENVRVNIYSPAEKISLKKESRLNVFVDGEPATTVQATLDDADGRFTEVAFRIPGSAIKGETSFVQIYGDHLAFCYWFYQ